MADRVRPYLFYDTAISICSICYRRADGKIVFEDGCVYLLKQCPLHGPERVLMADDVDYYRRCREVFLKPPEMPAHYNTPVRWGCPYDCGLCTDHEQHSCLTLVGDHGPLQPAMPHLLCRQWPLASTVPADRAGGAHARRSGPQRGPARRRPDFRR